MHSKAKTEIYIDKGDAQHNKSIFDKLLSMKQDFESLFGEELTWERLDEKRACRIAIYRSGTIEDDAETLEMIKNWMIEKLLKFKEVVNQNKEIKNILMYK